YSSKRLHTRSKRDWSSDVCSSDLNSSKCGYAENIPLEIIAFGDPDGLGRDLKAYNEILLRAESYTGWGILLPENFARIVEGADKIGRASCRVRERSVLVAISGVSE